MARVTIGKCQNCGLELRVTQEAAKAFMHLTCKCGWSGIVGEDRTCFCQICGKQRKATKAEEKEEALCPGACQQAMHQERLSRSIGLFSGPTVTAIGPLTGTKSTRTTRYCKFCGDVLPFEA